MFERADKTIRERLQKLEIHLQNENPLLLDAVARFKKLDRVAYRMGLLDGSESYATRIPWWPLISILGTFSAGKSSFINHFLGDRLQRTGNQAVDDKFTVITYANREGSQVLPGIALDSDPRFPFYQMSDEIDKVSPGEGRRIDAYLQMKTSNSEKLKGKIIIDSPGFDADDQRNTILRLTDHIMDLSDLVLVFFDARHPEPGAMQDTLEHLVADTIQRNDSEKFLYILNQIDTAAQEDNPEAVVAAWQRALAAKGLTAGRFYTIYNDEVAVPIEDEAVRQRFESKRDADLAEIYQRLHQVEVERSYRIIGALDSIAHDIENECVPVLENALSRWRQTVLIGDGIAFTLIAGLLFAAGQIVDVSSLFSFDFSNDWLASIIKLAVIASVIATTHFAVRRITAKWLARKLPVSTVAGNLKTAFLKSTGMMRSVFQKAPAGWNILSKRTLENVEIEASELIQVMNDRFTNPSGEAAAPGKAETLSVVEPATTEQQSGKVENKTEEQEKVATP